MNKKKPPNTEAMTSPKTKLKDERNDDYRTTTPEPYELSTRRRLSVMDTTQHSRPDSKQRHFDKSRMSKSVKLSIEDAS